MYGRCMLMFMELTGVGEERCVGEMLGIDLHIKRQSYSSTFSSLISITSSVRTIIRFLRALLLKFNLFFDNCMTCVFPECGRYWMHHR